MQAAAVVLVVAVRFAGAQSVELAERLASLHPRDQPPASVPLSVFP